MMIIALGFVIGVLWVQQSSALIPFSVYLILLSAGLGAVRLVPRARVIAWIGVAIALGAGYTSWHAQVRLDERLPDALDRAQLEWVGVVEGLPERREDGVRFGFRPDPDHSPQAVGPLLLSWYPSPDEAALLNLVKPGARLAVSIRLRKASSLFNAGGFDQAGWMLAKGWAGRGYVTALRAVNGAPGASLDGWRDARRSWIVETVPAHTAGPLVAMVLGEQGGIDDAQWAVFRATGTAHLVAISGLHVSIVAGLVTALLAFGWRRVPWLVTRWPARHAGLCLGVCAAMAYAALAGFGIPVMRAVIMLVVAAGSLMLRRQTSPFRVLLVAMVAVLLFDPWAVLSAGFWLSFGAVAALLAALSGRRGRRPRWQQFVIAQWAITWLTLPVMLGVFGAPAIVSPLANALAIPWVSLVLVPLLLLATVTGSSMLLLAASSCLAPLMQLLERMAAWQVPLAWPTPPLWLVVVVSGACFLVLLPRGTPLRRLAILCLVPLVIWAPSAPAPGALHMTVIDVGQGLSVLLRTATHAMLYDTGRAYYRGGDAGRSVVLPSLRAMGIHRLDLMVLSHDDIDHVGGASSLIEAMPVARIVGGVGVRVNARGIEYCQHGARWSWDGVVFEWIYPDAGAPAATDNDRSCVLRVATGNQSVLITGDITHRTEAALIKGGSIQKTSVVVAPHHGSRSSSSEAFVRTVEADHVIFSAGYRNAYGHPALSIVERWQAYGARAWNTAQTGAVNVDLTRDGLTIWGQARRDIRYWHRK